MSVKKILRALDEPVDSWDIENEEFNPDKDEDVAIFPAKHWPDTNKDSDNEYDGELNQISARELHSRAEVIIDFIGSEYSFEWPGTEPPRKKIKEKVTYSEKSWKVSP